MHKVNYFFSMHVNEICPWIYVYTLYYTQATEQRSVTIPYYISLDVTHPSQAYFLIVFCKCLAVLL